MDYQDAVTRWLEWKLRKEHEPLEWFAGIEHAVTCGLVADKTKVDFGTASQGYCETCYYEYPAIIYSTTCNCGQYKVKDADIMTDDGYGMADLLREIFEAAP